MDYIVHGVKELDMTERFTLHFTSVGIKENKPRKKDRALIAKNKLNEIISIQYSITPLITT